MPTKRKKKPSFTREQKRKSKLMGLKPSQLSPSQLKNLDSVTYHGLKHGVVGFRTISFKIPNMEAEQSETPIVKSKVPFCVARLFMYRKDGDYDIEALSKYQDLYFASLPSVTVSLEPRMGGGFSSGDNYNEKSSDAYADVSKAFMSYYKTRKEGVRARNRLEWLLTLPDNAVLSMDQKSDAEHYAPKLKQVFGIG